MAEGGLFPWKVQKLLSRGLAGNYSFLCDPLPKPPSGMEWKEDEGTREWKLAETGKEPELVPEEQPVCLVELPKEVIDQNVEENEWEVLSERASSCSVGGGGIFVTRAGSVRSINSMEQKHPSHTTLSVPYKIQRTASSSTIDSQDNALGPSGKGVLGVDYVEHVVLPTDTLQGILIAYKVSASNLRRANHFTGHSLHFAPKKLLIPLSKQALRTGFIRVQDTDSKEYKLHYFQVEYPDLILTEAKAYLELADWELNEALQSAKEDRGWEKEVDDADILKAGQIGIKVNFTEGGKPNLRMKGTGLSHSAGGKEQETAAKLKKKVVVHAKLPAIATKSVLAEDVYNAASEHSSFGVELKSLSKRRQVVI